MAAFSQRLSLTEPVSLLALGDSYTIGESVPTNSRWPVLLIDSLSRHGVDCLAPRIIAATGWRTDNLKQAIRKSKFKKKYNLVSLLIGVNNFYQKRPIGQYETEFEELLKKAIELADNNPSHVMVLSIPDYGYTPYGKSDQENITRGIDAYNVINRKISDQYEVIYIDITDISRMGLEVPELVATDQLHPSREMYAQWVSRLMQVMVFPRPKGPDN